MYGLRDSHLNCFRPVWRDGFAPQARELLIEQTASSVAVRLEIDRHSEQ